VLTTARNKTDALPDELFFTADLTMPDRCAALVSAAKERMGGST
jgi:hypothetical protein